MDSKKYWDEVVPTWVKDAIASGDVLKVEVADNDMAIPVISPDGAFSISLLDLIEAYNELHETQFKFDPSGEIW